MPKYSIILPVRNGSNHIQECVKSILQQTIADLELIILENCSTDHTLDIVHSFNDPRIKIIPADKPLSIEENWSRITTIPRNEFMTLIGHDDVLDTRYLETMEQLIKKFPDASLYQTHFRYIDALGKELKKCRPMPEKLLPAEVVAGFMTDKISLTGTGFMMRTTAYDQVGGIPAYPKLLFADMELFIRLSLPGYMAVAPEECFSYRLHPAATTSVSSDKAFVDGFDRLVHYFRSIKTVSPAINKAVTDNADFILSKYCQGISHKILKTPPSKRQTPDVSSIIDQFSAYGEELKGDHSFDPLAYKKIRLGKTIDQHPLYHALFLAFKRFYKKPVLS